MKKSFIAAFAAALFITSCSHVEPVADNVSAAQEDSSSLIAFTVGGCFDADVTTKATAVTSLSSFNCVAVTSSSQALVWGPLTFSKSGSSYTGGRYWPTTDPKYSFYASNATLTHSSSGCTVSPADNGTDVVVAYLASPTYQASNTLTFNHIYSRVGTVNLTADVSDATVTVNSVTLKSAVTSGTYNLKTDAWTTKGTGADQTLTNGSNDFYVVPGTYTLSVNYKYVKGDYTETLTKTASVSIVQGKINSISGKLSGDASDIITFSVTITAWGSNPVSVTL